MWEERKIRQTYSRESKGFSKVEKASKATTKWDMCSRRTRAWRTSPNVWRCYGPLKKRRESKSSNNARETVTPLTWSCSLVLVFTRRIIQTFLIPTSTQRPLKTQERKISDSLCPILVPPDAGHGGVLIPPPQPATFSRVFAWLLIFRRRTG